VTKSRKLLLAGALLAGGYGVACLLGGAPDPAAIRNSLEASTSNDVGLMASFRSLGAANDRHATIGQLVPDTGPVRGLTAAADALVPQQTPQQPTWLSATSSDRATLPAITPPAAVEPPKLAEAPAFANARPMASASPDVAAPATVETAPELPKATITNVVASNAPAVANNAGSPWDRWPAWDARIQAANSSASTAASSPPSLSSTPPATPPIAMTASYATGDSVRAIPSSFESVHPQEHSGARTHVVIDGDSLAKLADRYLDDESLAEEIFRLNRDVLTDAELLPIGVEIRIPDPRVAASPHLLAGASSLTASTGGPPEGMVPVEWRPRPFESEPRAQLLRPVPAGRGN
jgi:hypothetical protein